MWQPYAAQIAEAEREAVKDHQENRVHLEEPFRCPNCFAEGFRAARDKAAGIAEECEADYLQTGSILFREIVERIRAIEDGNG